MRPADLDLPEKFTDFRNRQLEIAAKVNVSKKYAYLLDAPTGVGKSLIAATVQKLMKQKVVYVCTTKQLQDQLMRDFPYARTLKGRANYVCIRYPSMYPQVSAEDCNHSDTNECKLRNKCPYMMAKREALAAPIAVLNMAYYLSETNYVGSFADSELLIIDEFDTAEDQLMSFVELVITQRQLERLSIPAPKFKTKFESWVQWAQPTLAVTRKELNELEAEMSHEDAWDTINVKGLIRLKELRRLVSKLKFFVAEVDKNWVWYPGDDRWSFKPVWVSKYAYNNLWKHTKRILGMSATILDPAQVALDTGLAMSGKSQEYIQMPSPFPKENRPIYFEPAANVINKQMNEALPALVTAVKSIMGKHPNDRILCHTVSYKIRDYLRTNIPGNRIITHSAKDRAEVLDVFKKSSNPLVLLSPSMDRGVDLPEDECRVVIICKMPYAGLGDPQVNKRVHASKDGSNWYALKTVRTVVQMAGRGVRSETDFAETYILDKQFERLYNEHRRMFPAWFQEAVVM